MIALTFRRLQCGLTSTQKLLKACQLQPCDDWQLCEVYCHSLIQCSSVVSRAFFLCLVREQCTYSYFLWSTIHWLGSVISVCSNPITKQMVKIQWQWATSCDYMFFPKHLNTFPETVAQFLKTLNPNCKELNYFVQNFLTKWNTPLKNHVLSSQNWSLWPKQYTQLLAIVINVKLSSKACACMFWLHEAMLHIQMQTTGD